MMGLVVLDDAAFDAERARLAGLAYRITGSYADAEDVVQEVWLRARSATAPIRNPAAWLTTVTSRAALDRLRAQARRREDYVGPWLPEPVAAAGGAGDPADLAALSDSLHFGFLVVLDQLSPVERVVFLLSDVFGEPFARIAEVTGSSEAACRQIAVRARRRVRASGPPDRPAADPLLSRLVAALLRADEAELVALLHPEARLLSDGGAARHAARRPVVGAARVARFLAGLARRGTAAHVPGWTVVNGQRAFTVHVDGRVDLVLMAEERDGRVVAIELVSNPDKLAHVDAPVRLA